MKPASTDYVCRAEFGPPFLRQGEHIAADLGWVVQAVSASGPDLIVVNQTIARDRSLATVRGGKSGHVYMLTSQVRTSFDRTLRRSFVLRVTG